MALRLIELSIPERDADTLKSLLKGQDVFGTWIDTSHEAKTVVHIIVEADEAEEVMDRVLEQLGEHSGLRMLLTPIEAVHPRNENNDETITDEINDEVRKADRVSREELYGKLRDTLRLSRVFLALCVLSAIVAALGMLQDDAAVIIGAMVIAPLLGPNIAMALGTTLGDLPLVARGLLTTGLGLAACLVVAVTIGLVVPIDPEIPALEARTQVDTTNLLLALAAGAAGTLAFTRGLSGAVIGVAVAVALVPPWVAFGMFLGAGLWPQAAGALLLVSANIVCINLAGVITFFVQGVRPRGWWEEQQATRARWIALALWLVLLGILVVLIVYGKTE